MEVLEGLIKFMNDNGYDFIPCGGELSCSAEFTKTLKCEDCKKENNCERENDEDEDYEDEENIGCRFSDMKEYNEHKK